MAYPLKRATLPSEKLKTGRGGAGPFHGLSSPVIKENIVLATNIDIHDPNWRKDVGIMGPAVTILVTAKAPVKLVKTPMDFAINSA